MANTQFGPTAPSISAMNQLGNIYANGVLGSAMSSGVQYTPMVTLPVKVQLCLTVCNVESGYVVTTNDMARDKPPKVYAGSTLEQCVTEIMAEIVARKLEA